jgi:hypothetical protein
MHRKFTSSLPCCDKIRQDTHTCLSWLLFQPSGVPIKSGQLSILVVFYYSYRGLFTGVCVCVNHSSGLWGLFLTTVGWPHPLTMG